MWPGDRPWSIADGRLPQLGFNWNAGLSYGDNNASNAIIHGDSLQVFGHAEGKSFERRARLIYIDPPYNNQEEYRHYADRSSHETWLHQIENSSLRISTIPLRRWKHLDLD